MIRISFLPIASILLLSIATSCEEAKSDSYEESFRQIENRRIVMNQQNENSKQGDLQAIRASGAVYSIVTRNRTPWINPGGKVEIEVFLSGHGMPEKNKLFIGWSSPYIIDEKDAGVVTSCIGFAVDKVTGKTQPVAGKPHLRTHKITPDNIIIILNKGYFSEMPLQPEDKEASESEIPRAMSEYTWDNEPPILLSINTTKDAPPGDYNITFAFTYGNEQSLLQDYQAVQFHITSRWERIQGWVVPIGIIIAFVSLLITAFGTISRICRGP